MKKYICILASAALFTACEQKTESVTPGAPADHVDKTEHNTTIVNPSPTEAPKMESTTNNTTINPPPAPMATATAPSTPADMSTTTTTTSTPNP